MRASHTSLYRDVAHTISEVPDQLESIQNTAREQADAEIDPRSARVKWAVMLLELLHEAEEEAVDMILDAEDETMEATHLAGARLSESNLKRLYSEEESLEKAAKTSSCPSLVDSEARDELAAQSPLVRADPEPSEVDGGRS